MTNIREELAHKLDQLSTEQINLVCQFVESLDVCLSSEGYSHEEGIPLTNKDIDRVVESYRKQNKPLPIGLAKGEFIVPDNFNEPLPDDILDLFEPK